MRRHVLVLHPLLPRPDQCSGDYQLVQLLRLLRRADCGVTLVAWEQLAERADRARYARALHELGCEVRELLPGAVAGQPWSWEMGGPRLRAVLDRNVFDAALVSFWNLAARAVPLLRQAAPDLRVVVHSWDVWHLREARGGALEGKLRHLQQVASARHHELGAYALADAVLAVTDQDRDVIAAGLRAEAAAGGLPTGRVEPPPALTVTHTHPVAADPPGWEGRRDVIFVGYFVHPPNVDAALWLAREVWPRAARKLPGARLLIAGGHVPDEVRALAGPRVEVLGFVPDLEPLLDRCRVAVAPLRYGAGLKGKVTQALAAGLPVVTTPCGAEGLPFVSGTHGVLGADAAALADGVAALYRDEALWARCARSGQALIRARHGDAVVAAPLLRALFGPLPAPAAAPALPAEIAALQSLLDGLEWQHVRRTPDLAAACFAEAARLDPELAAAPLAQAALELDLNEPRRADEAWRRARRLAPQMPGLLPVQAEIQAALGDRAAAREAAAKLAAADPRDPVAMRLAGELTEAAGDRAKALKLLTAGKEAHPNDLPLHLAFARSATAAGLAGAALTLWAQARGTASRTGRDVEARHAQLHLDKLTEALAGEPLDPTADDETALAPAAGATREPARAGAATADTAPDGSAPNGSAANGSAASAPAPGGAAPRPEVSIVVLAHNARDCVARCLEALRAHTGPAHEIVLVDNASTDGARELLRAAAAADPRCRLLESPVNLGFAAGNNLGLAAARGDWIVLLNSDVVVTAGWLDRLLACARAHPRAGLVGPATNRISGPQEVPVSYDQESRRGLARFAARLAAERAGQAARHWRAVGFCVLIRRDVVARVGGLDPRFGIGNFEDDDYCLRAHLAGFEIWHAHDAFVHHEGGRSFAAAGVDRQASILANWEVFKAKWGLPATAAYGQAHDFGPYLAGGFDPARHFVPLPDPAVGVAATAAPVAAPTAGGQATATVSAAPAAATPAAAVPAAAATLAADAAALLAAGEEEFRAGRHQAAAARFRQVLAGAPDHARARNDLACALWELGERTAALAELEQARAAAPDDRDVAWNLGQFLGALGREDEAQRLYAAFLARHPEATEFLASRT